MVKGDGVGVDDRLVLVEDVRVGGGVTAWASMTAWIISRATLGLVAVGVAALGGG